MPSLRTIPCILLILVLSVPLTRAQDRDDFGIWQSIDVGTAFSDKWSGGLWFEHRSKGDAKVLDCALVMPYAGYRASRHVYLEYASEFIRALDGWYVTCRPSATLILGTGHFSFALRELPIYEHCLDTGTGTWTLRTRGKVSYALPQVRLKPYMSCELFNTRRWEKIRYCLGSTWSFGQRSSLELFYLCYVWAGVPTQRHILGLGYALSI